MLNDLAWRKVPRNIIRDENIEYISYLLPNHLKAAPMLLYFIMYCKADDEGVIDLEDGAIYSRLMMNIASPKEVIDIADLMVARKLLVPVLDGYNVYIIDDWDIPTRPGIKTARTMEERRNIVARKIQEEQNRKKQRLETVDFDKIRNETNFFCSVNDKNAKNVDMTESRENLESRESLKETTQNLEIEKKEKTHTEALQYAGFMPPIATPREVQTKIEPTQEKNIITTDEELKEFVDQVLNKQQEQEKSTTASSEYATEKGAQHNDIQSVYVIFKDFFAKNCLGFSESKYTQALNDLAEVMLQLEDEYNPATAIAMVFCKQFKLLSETEGYYKNIALLPDKLLNPNVYKTVLGMASKILCNTKSANVGWIQQTKALKDIPNERCSYDELKRVCVQSGINPDSEHLLKNFLLQKVTAIK